MPDVTIAVVGGGPAGLMAAEVLVQAGLPVEVFDAMPSVGRKFLLAGKGGLNLTHAEPIDAFMMRYGARRATINPCWRPSGRQRCASGRTGWASTLSSALQAACFRPR